MKEKLDIKLFDKYFYNVCTEEEAQTIILLIKNEDNDEIIGELMKTQWDRLDNDELILNKDFTRMLKHVFNEINDLES